MLRSKKKKKKNLSLSEFCSQKRNQGRDSYAVILQETSEVVLSGETCKKVEARTEQKEAKQDEVPGEV